MSDILDPKVFKEMLEHTRKYVRNYMKERPQLKHETELDYRNRIIYGLVDPI